MAAFEKTLTILSIDPTDADELLELGMRYKILDTSKETLLLVVPLIPEGSKEEYNFCDSNNYDTTVSYRSAFKMAFWLAKAFPDLVVFVDSNCVDERNPVSQKIYHHLSANLPDVEKEMGNDPPQNLCLCCNDFKMIINTHYNITTNVGRPCTGFMYLANKFNFVEKVNQKIYVQGGSIWGKESGTVNLPDMFCRTPRESMNMARNPTAFLELVKMVKGNIRIIPTAYTNTRSIEDINLIIDSVYIPEKSWVNMPYMLERKEVLACIELNKCCKKYYSQERFKNGAKLFDLDLFYISTNSDEHKFNKMKCAIKKGLGEMELHNGELNDNIDYEHFPEVEVIDMGNIIKQD